MVRFHVLLDEAEKEEFRRLAEREGKSLGEWLRAAARDRADAMARDERIDSVADLDAFFQRCDRRAEGHGPEPDWDVHKAAIEASKGGIDVAHDVVSQLLSQSFSEGAIPLSRHDVWVLAQQLPYWRRILEMVLMDGPPVSYWMGTVKTFDFTESDPAAPRLATA